MKKIGLFITFIFIVPVLLSASELWVERYNGSADRDDDARYIGTDLYGNVYVAGESWGMNEDLVTIKFDPNGTMEWVNRYNGPGNGEDHIGGMAVDHLGNIFTFGDSDGGDENDDFVLIKYGPDGDTLWVSRYDGPNAIEERAEDIVLDAEGDAYVCGASESGSTMTDFLTIKYYADGDTAWTRWFNGARDSIDYATDIALGDDGSVYVAGNSWGQYYDDIVLIKYDSLGNEKWVKRYDGAKHLTDNCRDLKVGSDGNIYITGFCNYGYDGGSFSYADYITLKYDTAGTLIWDKLYNYGSTDNPVAIDVDDSGNVYVVGESWNDDPMLPTVTIIKYRRNGTVDWSKRYQAYTAGIQRPSSILVDEMGYVYVLASCYTNENTLADFVTLVYNGAGSFQKIEIYSYNDEFAHDYARAMTLDLNGNIYVTGSSFDNATGYDIAVVKYSGISTDVTDEPANTLPKDFSLEQNYPNPFNSSTVIEFALEKRAEVNISIYDLLGRRVRTILDKELPVGEYRSDWDGFDEAGERVASGTYFYKLSIDGHHQTKKMVYLK